MSFLEVEYAYWECGQLRSKIGKGRKCVRHCIRIIHYNRRATRGSNCWLTWLMFSCAFLRILRGNTNTSAWSSVADFVGFIAIRHPHLRLTLTAPLLNHADHQKAAQFERHVLILKFLVWVGFRSTCHNIISLYEPSISERLVVTPQW